MMLKVKHNMSPKYINDLFEIPNKRYDLRNVEFKIPIFNTFKYGKHSLRQIGSFLWSKLNGKERTNPSINNFRICIRKKDLKALLNDNACNEHFGICNFS